MNPSFYLSIYLSIYLWLYSPMLGLGRFFNFSIFYTVGMTPWTGNQPVARPLLTHRTTQTRNKRTQISMPQVGFEPTIAVFERGTTVHALDRAGSVNGEHIVQHTTPALQTYTTKGRFGSHSVTEEQLFFNSNFRSTC
jgi:hypothetical protein